MIKTEKHDYVKEYKDKAEKFAYWFTSILISVFIYLIHKKSNTIAVLEQRMWDEAFVSIGLALILLFIWQVTGVIAAFIRASLDERSRYFIIEQIMEFFNSIFFIGAFLAGLKGFYPGGILLLRELFKA